MAQNFNDLLPAAPALCVNGKWQRDVAGNASVYFQVLQAAVDLTAQVADIPSTTVVATPPLAMYRVTAYIVQTVAATTSGTLPKVMVVFTDGDTTTVETLDLTATNSANVVGTAAQGSAVFYAAPTADMSYQTSGYASVGGTALEYALHVRVELLN